VVVCTYTRAPRTFRAGHLPESLTIPGQLPISSRISVHRERAPGAKCAPCARARTHLFATRCVKLRSLYNRPAARSRSVCRFFAPDPTMRYRTTSPYPPLPYPPPPTLSLSLSLCFSPCLPSNLRYSPRGTDSPRGFFLTREGFLRVAHVLTTCNAINRGTQWNPEGAQVSHECSRLRGKIIGRLQGAETRVESLIWIHSRLIRDLPG